MFRAHEWAVAVNEAAVLALPVMASASSDEDERWRTELHVPRHAAIEVTAR